MHWRLICAAFCFVLCTWLGSVARGADDGSRPDLLPAEDMPQPLVLWSFDDSDHRVIASSGSEAGQQLQRSEALPRVPGVLGSALELSGAYQLQMPPFVLSGNLPQITFSAWARPTDLSGYRELYRQECPERILFSFQGSGSILSLGLNIGGYHECDAPIDPSLLIDGGWHHVAATYDGQTMRVYLDGREMASQERPGMITTNPQVPAFIGSSDGAGEFFQGGLDDLRIFGTALSPEQLVRIYREGLETLSARFAQYQQKMIDVYQPGDTFARSLVNLRQAMAQETLSGDRDFVGLLLTRLRSDFPDQSAEFARATGSSPLQYLTAGSDDSVIAMVGRYVEMMQEYKPLTPDQIARMTADERNRWERVEQIATEFAALKSCPPDQQDPARWIEVLLAAAKHTQQRPTVSEAVAPYRPPSTPATQDLTETQAREVLQRDWLHQAEGNPHKERILREIAWTRQLADRIVAESPSPIDLSGPLATLDTLQRATERLPGPDAELYYRVREVKRAIVLQNGAIDFDGVLFVDMPYPDGSEWRHETRHRLGYMAVPGARLMVLEGLSPSGHLRQLMPQAPLHGSFWRPDLSYDAQKVLFCFKPHNEKAFHLYEINIDGTELVQLTEGPYDDLDPIYLPDGKHLMFSTTRGHTYVRCMPPTNAFVLARCNTDGSDIYLISQNNEPDYLPSVMDDGRIVYTRWEYTDKPLWRAQGLWTVNPDGTQVNTLWGNQSVWPDLLKDARQIPGSRRIMFTGSAHHDWFSGSVGIVDPLRGFNFPDGLTKVTADVPWPESGNGPVDPMESSQYHASGNYDSYYSPFPLSERDFLVSACRAGKFLLYWMDVEGNRELIYEGTHNILHALPIRPRLRPPLITDRVDWPQASQRLEPQQGVIFSGNVYQGAPEQLQGQARYLRVLNIEPKTYTYWHQRPYLSTGPVVSAVQSEGVKRILGTVELEPDGSVAFHAPAGMALHFQLLDERQRALHTMRSFTGVMPGEQRGCLGCHESHSRAPEYSGSSLALTKEPQTMTPPPWGNESISYTRFVRPVLDQYCASCHEGDGEGRTTFDTTPRVNFLFFDETYMILTGRPSWGAAYVKPQQNEPGLGAANMLMVEGYDTRDPAAYQTTTPMTHMSYNSPLIELASSGKHYDVQVDSLSLLKLIAWVDTMCPYRGSEEVRELDDPEFQGIDWLSIRPRIKTAPTIVRPGPVE